MLARRPSRWSVIALLGVSPLFALLECSKTNNVSSVTNNNGPDAGDEAAADSAPPPADASEAEAAVTCADIEKQVLATSLAPPSKVFGLDLTSGAKQTGFTFEEANARWNGCLQTQSLIDIPGSRSALLGSSIKLYYNLDTHSIDRATAFNGWTGTLTFNSRAGGPFGTHKYEIGIGYVRRDGVGFPADWNHTGSGAASAWANELVDGMIATFAPGNTQYNECLLGVHTCQFAEGELALLGVLPLGLQLRFTPDSNQLVGWSQIYAPAAPSCQTSADAAVETQLYAPITGPLYQSIGTLRMAKGSISDAGLTKDEANGFFCGTGVTVTPTDPAYGALTWGPNGEILFEYNKTTNVTYKLFANAGYQGVMDTTDLAGTFEYLIGIGVLQKIYSAGPDAGIDAGPFNVDGGAPFAIDWNNPLPAITELSNVVNWSYGVLGANDTDCVAAGHCTITPFDGGVGTTVGFLTVPLYLVFQGNKQTPTQIYQVWKGGQ
jgi:hypothetical protein